jgi:glycosyltransferase involved in cell wall biosynthesis
MNKIRSVGLTGYYLDPAGVAVNNTVFGSKVAVKDLLKAMMQFSTSEELVFSYVDMYYQHIATQRMHRQLKKSNEAGTDLKFVNRIDMLQKGVKIESDIIHDLYSDFFHTLHLREHYSSKKPPITYTIHCASSPNYSYGYYLVNLLSGLQSYDSMICTSKAVKEAVHIQLEQMLFAFNRLYNTKLTYNGRLDVIPLGVDRSKIYPVNQREARAALNLSDDAFVILYFGRISAFDKADILPLIKVFKRLLNNNLDRELTLIVAGTDYQEKSSYPAIESYISKMQIGNHIRLLKTFDFDKRNLLYSAADVFTSPIDSIQETFGLTPIEAMACGVPQIVSDWDGYKDTVRHEITGFKVPTYWSRCDRDISLFPTAVANEFGHESVYSHFLLSQSVAIDLELYEAYFQRLIDAPGLCRAMSENSLKISEEEYSLKVVVRKYEELWEELLAIKKTATESSEKYIGLFNNRYCEAFNGYATRMISDEERVAITEDGNGLLNGDEPYPFHYQEEKVLSEFALAPELLRHLQTVQHTRIKELIEKYSIGVNEDVVRRSVMWLLKQGFMKLESAAGRNLD